MKIFWISTCALGLAVSGCATQQIAKANKMTRDECSRSDWCIIEGTLGIREVDHVEMGRLSLSDGRCVNVSLSNRQIRTAKKRSGQRTMIEGRVLFGKRDATFAFLEVNGRRVGPSQCGDFYVFVDDGYRLRYDN